MRALLQRLRPPALLAADVVLGIGESAGIFVARTTRRWPLAATLVGLLLVGALFYALVDRPLAIWFKGHLGAQTEGFLKTVTALGSAWLYLIPSLVAWLFCRWEIRRTPYLAAEQRLRGYAASALYVFLSVSLTGLFAELVKTLAGRLRPKLLFEQGIYGFHPLSIEWAMNSFPSGHTQTIFAAMTALVFVIPRYDLAWLAIAVLVAASRVITSVHYLTDVMMGAYIGLAGAILLRRLFAARGVDVRLRFARDRWLAE